MIWRTFLPRLRATSQVICLLGILLLFLATDYRGEDHIPYPVSLLFRLDPLALVADLLAPGAFHWQLLWPAILLVIATGLFGRFFCGWICPMGALLDGCGVFRKKTAQPPLPRKWRRTKYYLLATTVAAAALGVQLFSLLDPLSLFLRSLTISLFPAFNWLMNRLFDGLYALDIGVITEGTDRAYPLIRENLMAFHQPHFQLSVLTFAIFAGILLLEKIERRFWCRNLCPLGALLGLCSSHGLVERVPTRICPDCLQCESDCRMNAVQSERNCRSECVQCMDCLEYCPYERTRFLGIKAKPALTNIDLSRRGLITSVALGAIFAPVAHTAPPVQRENQYLVRPPGAVAEDEFLRRCIRCGECLKVCIGNALQPALLEAGLLGLWSPIVVARHGYCEYHCTLCGQVCPTGAIRELPAETKIQTVIGLAVIDQKLCLPYARGTECLVCEEHCPTGKKAIVLESRNISAAGHTKRLKVPQVVPEQCIGCGICETRCPTQGISAIRVINEGETRHLNSQQ